MINRSVFEIKQEVTGDTGENLILIYREEDPLRDLGDRRIGEVRAYCFFGDKLVIIYEPKKGCWNLPGGKIEEGENYKDAILREVKEEINMGVLTQEVIGYLDIYKPKELVPRYVYSFCAVKELDNFVADPDGDISEIKLIEPKDCKDYLGQNEVADRVMVRALELRDAYGHPKGGRD